MTLDRRLLSACLDLAPSQPATALGAPSRSATSCDRTSCRARAPVSTSGAATAGSRRLVGRARCALDAHRARPRPSSSSSSPRACGIYDVLLRADGGNVDAQDESFDFVFSNSVLEHVDELEPLLAEVGRVLRRGGRFVFTVPSVRFHENLGGPGALGRLATGPPIRTPTTGPSTRASHTSATCPGTSGRRASRRSGWMSSTRARTSAPEETRRWATVSNATAGVLVQGAAPRGATHRSPAVPRCPRRPSAVVDPGSRIPRSAASQVCASEAATSGPARAS